MRLIPLQHKFAKLRVLRVPDCELTGVAAAHLAKCHLPRLLELDWSCNHFDRAGDLIQSSLGNGLRVLNLEDTKGIGASGFQQIFADDSLPRISELRMNGIDHTIEFVPEALFERFGDRLVF